MKKFFDVFNFASSMVFQLERDIPQSGAGPAKLSILLDAVKIAASLGSGFGPIGLLVSAVTLFAANTVATMNAQGLFSKGQPPSSPTA